MEETYVDRMKVEYKELSERLRKGMSFMTSEKGQKLDVNEQVLLTQQLNAMQLYAYFLSLRIRVAETKTNSKEK